MYVPVPHLKHFKMHTKLMTYFCDHTQLKPKPPYFMLLKQHCDTD